MAAAEAILRVRSTRCDDSYEEAVSDGLAGRHEQDWLSQCRVLLRSRCYLNQLHVTICFCSVC